MTTGCFSGKGQESIAPPFQLDTPLSLSLPSRSALCDLPLWRPFDYMAGTCSLLGVQNPLPQVMLPANNEWRDGDAPLPAKMPRDSFGLFSAISGLFSSGSGLLTIHIDPLVKMVDSVRGESDQIVKHAFRGELSKL